MQMTMEALDPVYKRQILLNLVTMIIPVLLMAQVLHRKHKTPEIRIFFFMCLANIVYCAAAALLCLVMICYSVEYQTFWEVLLVAGRVAGDIACLAVVMLWLHFVEFTLHQSRDIIKRRYLPARVLFWIGALLILLSVITPCIPVIPFYLTFFTGLGGKIARLILGVCILQAYIVWFREKKRVSIPRYIRLTPTVISFILGYLLTVVTYYRLIGLGLAAGLMFADFYMFRRLSYIDPATGFYREKYLPVLEREAGRKGIHEAMVIRFKTSGDGEKLAGILKNWEPEHSRTVIGKDGEFLVLSRIKKNALAERFISLVREQCQKEGLETEASCEMIRR